jgi:CheY-like chemotaxis protein
MASEASEVCRVLVADPDEERAKSTAEALEAWGMSPLVVHDGVEAMLAIARSAPSVVVLDAALPKMYGFQVCEVVKRIASLSQTRVVLVGAIHQESRYRRNPSDLYGADVYLEQPDLPDGLHPLLREAGLPVRDMPTSPPAPRPPVAPPAATPAPTPPPAPRTPVVDPPSPAFQEEEEPLIFETEPPSGPGPVTEQAAPSPDAGVTSEHQEEIERAERLARIAVSEMVLYQPDKFDRAAREGNLTTVLDLEIQEARALIRQRVSQEVRAERDFILEELSRVARERGSVG